MCRATVRRGHRALTGEAADGMESGRTRTCVAALARVMMATVAGEAGDVWRVGCHVVQIPWGGKFWDGTAGEGSFALGRGAGFALCDAD